MASAIFFAIDSVRRRYRSEKVLAIALAMFGLLSFGLGSAVYYALWGYRSLEPPGMIYGTALCATCLATTTDQAAPGAFILNRLVGTRYMGSLERCDQCLSVVRTLWFWFLLPLFPLGSYRVVALDEVHFVGKRTSLDWPHVIAVYIMVLVAAGVVAVFAMIR